MSILLPDRHSELVDVIVESNPDGTFTCCSCLLDDNLQDTLLGDILTIKSHLDCHVRDGHEVSSTTWDSIDELVDIVALKGGLDDTFINRVLSQIG